MRAFRRNRAVFWSVVFCLLLALAVPANASAGTQINDYSYFCYHIQVWHGTPGKADRSDRVAVSQQLSYPYHWRLFYQAYGYHNWFGREWWSHDFDYSCLSSRGYQ